MPIADMAVAIISLMSCQCESNRHRGFDRGQSSIAASHSFPTIPGGKRALASRWP